MVSATPQSEAEVADAVRAAADAQEPLEIVGGGTKAGLGRPVQAAGRLDLSKLTGITLYEPGELVIAARAGTPLAEIEATLADNGQALPFEPLDPASLWGTGTAATIGGTIACNLSGPARVALGAARDSLIGVRLVNGRGEAVKAGGRVMKNVTGYDVSKLAAGSYGTLGALTEVTMKVVPVSERQVSLALDGLTPSAAVKALSAALGSPYEVIGAAWRATDDGAIGAETAGTALLRLQGFSHSVDYRVKELEGLLAPHGPIRTLPDDEGLAIWRDLKTVAGIAPASTDLVWRISIAQMSAPAFLAALPNGHGGRAVLDWGGGLIWLALPSDSPAAGEDGGVTAVRQAVDAAGGGHATLFRAPETVRAAIDVFQPRDPVTLALSARVKASFDPKGILNPGRMYSGV